MYGQGCREGADVGEGCMHGGADGGRSSWRREAVLAAGGDLGGGRRASLRREGGVPHSRGALPEAFGFGAGAGIGEEVEVGAQSNLREGKGVVVEDDGAPLEFTFPSLSDALGNAYYRARPSRSRSRSASPVSAPSPPGTADVVV